jgi:hypothetical protein
MHPFSPSGPSVKVNVTAAGVLRVLTPWVDSNGGTLSIGVRGAFPVFVAWGGAGVTCTEATGHWCPAGIVSTFGVPGSASHLYLITEAGQASDVQLAQGRGL